VTAFNGYPFSVILALLLHGLIVGAVLYMERASTQSVLTIQAPAVKAILVEENPQARNERVQTQRQEQQRQEQQRLDQQRQEEQRRQQEEQRAREEQQREEAARQEQERQAQLRRQQEEEQRQREDQERRAEEQRRQQDEQRRQQEAQQRQQEAAAAEARERAETEAEIIAAHTAIIHDLVQQRWSRPPSARNHMEAVLRIRLVPTGEVVDVEIVRSSGDAAFDRSAEMAVRSVGRFRELQGMPPRLFERSFRSLLLTFRPEDLRN
jgi:colicin import membrane protein